MAEERPNGLCSVTCREDDQTIARLQAIGAARHDGLSTAKDGADDAVARQREISEGLAVERSGHGELQDAALAFFENRQQARLTAFDLVKDRGDGGTAGRERDVDADALEQPAVVRPADPGDDATDAELTSEQRGQQIFLVVVDHARRGRRFCRCLPPRAARGPSRHP